MMETESHVRCWRPEKPPVAQRPAGDLGTAYRPQELADNPTKPVTAGDITQACCHICELTGVGEREIRQVVPSCTRARRQLSNSVPVYIDNFGATMKAEIPGRGFRLDLQGLQLNITTLIASQNHEQHYGIEHIAVQTDDYPGTLAKLKANGVRILEEMPPNNGGRHVCFLEAFDGAQMELIEKV